MRRKEARRREERKMKLPIRFRDVRGWRNKVEWIILRLFAVLAVASATGCLSVARIPIPERTVRDSEGNIIEQRFDSAVGHVSDHVGVFPTLKMRWMVLKLCVTGDQATWYNGRPDDRPPTAGQRVGGVLANVGLLVGLPFDIVVDTAFSIHDNRRHEAYNNGGARK